jgi:hypothetical protein
MPLTGDFKGLEELEKLLEDTDGLTREVNKAAADGIRKELERQYDKGVDPYNEAWADLAPSTIARGRTNPPLSDTHEMRRGTTVRGVGGIGGIRVRINKPSNPLVPLFHQKGTENMPARKVVPDAGTLSPAWEQAIRVPVSKVVIKHFKRK